MFKVDLKKMEAGADIFETVSQLSSSSIRWRHCQVAVDSKGQGKKTQGLCSVPLILFIFLWVTWSQTILKFPSETLHYFKPMGEEPMKWDSGNDWGWGMRCFLCRRRGLLLGVSSSPAWALHLLAKPSPLFLFHKFHTGKTSLKMAFAKPFMIFPVLYLWACLMNQCFQEMRTILLDASNFIQKLGGIADGPWSGSPVVLLTSHVPVGVAVAAPTF